MFEYINFKQKFGEYNKGDIKLFGLSTCGFCNRAVDFLEDNNIQYDHILVDELDPELKKRAKDGLLSNLKKYGFYHCPCRDTDDIKEWGQCFCGLYVSREFYTNKTELGSIPERRQ